MDSQIKISKGQIQNFISDLTQAALDVLTANKADLSSVVLKNGNTDGNVLTFGTNDNFNVRIERNNLRVAQFTAATFGLVEGISLTNDSSGNKFQLGIGSDTTAPTWSRNTADAISTAVFWNINNSNTGYIIEGRSGSASGGNLNFYVDKLGKVKVATATLDEHAINLGQLNTGLNLKANLASPVFSGIPTVPTATQGTSTLQIASTAFVQTAANAKVADIITDGNTTVAPSQNAVFDALALKSNIDSPTFTGVPSAPTAATTTNTTQLATTAFVQQELTAFGLKTKTGSSTQSGNGVLTSFNIPHGLGTTPTYFNVVATSQAAGNISYITANSTNIIVNYSVAPATGTNNLSWNWITR